MNSEHLPFIWPIADSDAKFLGTGFVVHLEESETAECRAYLVTCAHVVKGKDLTVNGRHAFCVNQAEADAYDLAVIEAVLPNQHLEKARLDAGMYVEAKGTVYGCTTTKTANGEECVITPVQFQLTKFLTYVPSNRPRYLKAQVLVDLEEQLEPDQIQQGFSGGPVMIDGSARAVLDANRDLLEKQIRSNSDAQNVAKPGKVGTAIPIQQLLEVWPEMPSALREQLEQSDRSWQPLFKLISAVSFVSPEIAREVFDAAKSELRSWPDRNSAASFGDCVQRLAPLESFQWNDCEYAPLAEYVRRVAKRLDDPGLAARLQEIAADAGFRASTVPEIPAQNILGESRQTLVFRIVPDVDAIAETEGSGPRLRLLPYLLEQRETPCGQPCIDVECRAQPVVEQSRLTLLGRHVLETSTGALCEDLRSRIPDLFLEFVGGVPDRVAIFLPRAYAASILNSELDRILFCLDFQVENEPEDSLNAWTIVCHHIDERLEKTEEWRKLAERLATCPGTIRLTKPAKSLEQLAKSPKPLYDSVVIDQERSSEVLHHLRSRRSLLCVRFHSRDSVRRNLATAVGAPLPFIAVARSPDAVGTLDRLLKKKSCLRRLPQTLKEQITANEPDADQIAVIVDLPECRCEFEQAIQEAIPNENL